MLLQVDSQLCFSWNGVNYLFWKRKKKYNDVSSSRRYKLWLKQPASEWQRGQSRLNNHTRVLNINRLFSWHPERQMDQNRAPWSRWLWENLELSNAAQDLCLSFQHGPSASSRWDWTVNYFYLVQLTVQYWVVNICPDFISISLLWLALTMQMMTDYAETKVLNSVSF